MSNDVDSNQDLEVAVNLTRRDLGYLTWYLVVRNKILWATGVALSAAILWSALKAGHREPELLKTVILTLVCGIILVSFVMCGAGFSALAAMLTAGRGAGVLGLHTYRISEEGLRETTDVNDSLMHWKGIFAVKDIGSYLLIYQTPALAHVLPRRCFSDGGDFAIFAAALREKLRIARGESR